MKFLRYALFAIVWLAFASASAVAHPLGNFTINRLVEIRPEAGLLRIRVVIDTAEIPTFQLMQTAKDEGARAEFERAAVTDGLHITVDGALAQPVFEKDTSRLRAGAAGLPIYYWVGDYRLNLSRAPHQIAVDDQIAATHLGWRDITLGNQTEPTHELLAYPSALLGSPRDTTMLAFEEDAAGAARATSTVSGVAENPGGVSFMRTNALSDMFASTNRTPWFVLLTIVVAFGLGALHALEPGHGKALMAFTLVGSRATAKQAVILASSLTFAHTVGVFLLGFALFFVTGFAAESIYPWITLISGAVIAVIGARTLGRFISSRRPHAHGGVVHEHASGHVHAHADDHHHGQSHEHGHDHSHGPGGHSHVIAGEEPMKFGPAIWAAMSGGIAPCPAAIVVMLAALRLHQLGYGMMLIVVFSMGLASVLTGIGLAVVHGAALLKRSRRLDRIVAYGPLGSSILISLIGAVMVAQGFAAQRITVPAWSVAVIVVAAIAGYAMTTNHTHSHAPEAA